MTRLVLASGSSGRLRLLRDAGFDPEVEISGVDETVEGLGTADAVVELARRKARAVAPRCPDAVVLGADSLLDVDGTSMGKPADREEAASMWAQMAERPGVLYSGLCVIDARRGWEAAGVARATVHFGRPSEEEVAAYLDTEDPLALAGAFSIDGRSAPFVEAIEGSHTTVIGLSLPLLRDLLGRLDLSVVDLWSPPPPPGPAGGLH